MNIHSLPSIIVKRKKRLGLGHGSGRVKTAGRGQKGQQARQNIPLDFEGGALPLIKRIPFLRGKDRNFSFQERPFVINLEKLGGFEKGATVDMKTIVAHGLISEKEAKTRGVKVLATGELKNALVVKLPTSKSAQAKIEKAGGSVQIEEK